MTKTGLSDLLRELATFGVAVYLHRNGKLAVRHPWRDRQEVPIEALRLLRQVKVKNREVAAFLKWGNWHSHPVGTVEVVRGAVVSLYPTRRECMEANACLWLYHSDCMRYPVFTSGGLSGFCRDRVDREVQQATKGF